MSGSGGIILRAIEAGEGPAVVLLHGLFGAARNFGAIQKALARRHRVIALDMRNHGDSPHAAGMRYTRLAEDVRETMRALGVAQAAVIGHSMGGKAAMALALTHPEAVGRVLVADIAPVAYRHHNAAIAAAMRTIPLSPALTRHEAEASLREAVPSEGVRAFLLQNLRFGPDIHWRIGLDEIAASVDDLEGWPGIDGIYEGPALFVTGAASDYVLPEHRPLIRSLFPRARFVAVKGAGHWLHADNPAGFLSVAEAFLRDWG